MLSRRVFRQHVQMLYDVKSVYCKVSAAGYDNDYNQCLPIMQILKSDAQWKIWLHGIMAFILMRK